jgi:hypothetical protein
MGIAHSVDNHYLYRYLKFYHFSSYGIGSPMHKRCAELTLWCRCHLLPLCVRAACVEAMSKRELLIRKTNPQYGECEPPKLPPTI